MAKEKCRFCSSVLEHSFCDLGMSPISNAFLKPEQLKQKEPFFPLHARVCHKCFLVQVPMFESPENIFKEYAYFSSYSKSWLEHAKRYTELMIERFHFDKSTQVVEIASNDGYLLQFFKQKGIRVLGVEPAENVALVAQSSAGIPTLVKFFGTDTAKEMLNNGIKADLLLGNNVLAHVPDLNDFVQGMQVVLAPKGVITMEFPHLLQLMRENQFDTIYHEHFSYFSLLAVEKVFEYHKLTIFDAEELPTHGGSLRIYARHSNHSALSVSERVHELRKKEVENGLDRMETYAEFAARAVKVKDQLLEFLREAKADGKKVVGYGAPAKGNTLLNFCKVGTELLPYTVDISPYKQGRFLPGVHIPVYHPDKIRETRPDYLLILPWNIKKEVMTQMAFIREWGGKFVLPIPETTVIS
jgi:SAM-dependent methyltransferase